MNEEKEPVPTLGEVCRDVAAGSGVLARRMLPAAGKGARAFVAFLGGAPLGKPKRPAGPKATAEAEKDGSESKAKPGFRARLRAKPAPTLKDSEKPAGDTAAPDAVPREDSESLKPDATVPTSGAEPVKKKEGTKQKDDEQLAGGLFERVGVGALTCAIGYAFLRPVLPAVGDALGQVAGPFALIGVVLWVVAAYRAAPRNDQEKEVGGEQPTPTAGPTPAEAAAAATWLRRLIIQRVQDAVAAGRRGVHLSALLDEPGIPATWTVTTLREHCERLEIPVKPIQIRGGKVKGPTHGVHVDQLTAALGMPLAQALQRLDRATEAGPGSAARTSWGDVIEAAADLVFADAESTPATPSPQASGEAAATPSPGEPQTPP
ncbi:hypothetical protein [Streptomyces fagopyri]|uniref:hypothetical protein n=1 Tax=Streptomyces fagopyri TaxID=2662397 RepID=UPI0038271FFB